MTRGRRKDLTIPPSRALLQQRDYRARKAQYVADLEDRARRAEEENACLKKEVEVLRMRLAAPGSMGPSPEVVTASSELMHQLTAAASCLARFQQLTFNEHHQAQAAAAAHAITQAHMQTQNLRPLPAHPELSPGPELPPIRTQPSAEQRVLPPASAVFSGTSRQPTPPRALHPSQHQPPLLQFHHHRFGSPPPLHVPGSSNEPRREFSVLHPAHPVTPRQTSVPSSSSASSSASVSTSPSALQTHMVVNGTTVRASSSSYTGYNEIENAWGYFDSRDLGASDEEDQLLEDDRRSPHHHHGHAGPSSQRLDHHRARSSSRMHQRTSDMRSTTSSSGEDTPMRLRDDSPMRTR